jgi:hypothetical protein
MNNAVATYQILSNTEALIEVTYPNGSFGMERVTKPRNGSLYETAYNAASIKAAIQGCVLGRFSMVGGEPASVTYTLFHSSGSASIT